jgi:hypothetical protein
MRKVTPGIVLRILFSVGFVLILSACIKPVGMELFLDDPKVVDIIEKGNIAGIDVDFEFEGIEKLAPKLISLDEEDTDLIEGGVISVPIDEIITAVMLTVDNANAYTAFEWYFNGTDPLPTTGSTLTLVFREGEVKIEMTRGITLVWVEHLRPGDRYPVSVIGKTAEGKPYASQFFIEFVG